MDTDTLIKMISPESFRQLLSAISLSIGILFSFFSMKGEKREHSLRIASLYFLMGITLFSDNAWCYFASVFIIATSVTKLDFLQNLAAIIRGSKEYFDYQKEFMSQKEVELTIAKEIEEIDEIEDEKESVAEKESENSIEIKFDKSNLTNQQFALICEEHAFKFFERKYDRPIQRHIRYRGKGLYIEFDGIMEMENRDLIFEIRVSRLGVFTPKHFTAFKEKMLDRVRRYKDITGRNANLVIVLVGNFTKERKQRMLEQSEDARSQITDFELVFKFLSLNEIGLQDFEDLQRAPFKKIG
jgi:hypothetical protein